MKFKTRAELNKKIEKYFGSRMEDGEIVKPVTLSSLAVHLGCDRRTLCSYSKKEKYYDIITAAKARIEAYVEEQLFNGKAATGIIFNLKCNFRWSDGTEEAVNEKTPGIVEIAEVIE